MANNCRGQSKIAQRLRDEATTRQTEEMQMRSDDRMTHRLALMAKAKGSQQGKGSHTDKGRGAREARPCTACAHALRGRPLPFSTCLEGQPSMGATDMTGNSFPRAQPIGFPNIHKIHKQVKGLVVKVSEGSSRVCVWCNGVRPGKALLTDLVTGMPRVAKTANEDEQTNAAELERPDPAQREGPKLNRKESSTSSLLPAFLARSAAGVDSTSKTLQLVQMRSLRAMLDAKWLPKVTGEAHSATAMLTAQASLSAIWHRYMWPGQQPGLLAHTTCKVKQTVCHGYSKSRLSTTQHQGMIVSVLGVKQWWSQRVDETHQLAPAHAA